MAESKVLFYKPIITETVQGAFLSTWSHWVGRKGHILVTGILSVFPCDYTTPDKGIEETVRTSAIRVSKMAKETFYKMFHFTETYQHLIYRERHIYAIKAHVFLLYVHSNG